MSDTPKDKADDNLPNRIQDIGYELVAVDPLVGILLLSTDDGEIRVAINRTLAAMLIEAMANFLLEPEDAVDEAVIEAEDATKQ